MATTVSFEPAASRLFLFEEVYPFRAAEEQAEKQKLGAFGMIAKFNLLNRPKIETVTLSKKERRLEPFWLVEARRAVDFRCEATYQVPVDNRHAQRIELSGSHYEVQRRGERSFVEVKVREHCHRKLDFCTFLDALKREIRPQTLQAYVARYKCAEIERIQPDDAVDLLLPMASVIQIATSKLAGEAINASEIEADELRFEKTHLFWRPVYAFEYIWTTTGRTGVIEVDGLTGEIVQNGTWFKDKLERVLTPEMMFEAGAEVAGALVPGGSVAVKVIARLATP